MRSTVKSLTGVGVPGMPVETGTEYTSCSPSKARRRWSRMLTSIRFSSGGTWGESGLTSSGAMMRTSPGFM